MNQKEVYNRIVKAGIAHPDIVLKQAIHESANFKSNAARKRNNIFGIRQGKKTFSSIDACINFYKKKITSQYNGGDYFKFLSSIPYAEDPLYKKKVNNIKLDFIIE